MADDGLRAWIAEALEPVGTVTARKMMGGETLYLDGIVFAIIAFDALWFKADRISDSFWDEAGCARFSYERDGGTATMNYRRAPDDVHDDAEAMREYARPAIEAGLRGAKRKPGRKPA